ETGPGGPGTRLLAPSPPRRLATDLDRMAPSWRYRARRMPGRQGVARCRQLQATIGRGQGADQLVGLSPHGLAGLRVVGGRGQDGSDGIQEVTKRKAAHLASLVGEAPALLVEPRPP